MAQTVVNLPPIRRPWFEPWVSPRKGNGNTLVFLPGESHGQRSLGGYSAWGCKESDMTEMTEYTHI